MTDPTNGLGEIVIARRFNGPEQSANGGYACGALARFLDEPAEVCAFDLGCERDGPVGRLTARRERDVRVGEQLVAVGWTLGAKGRKHETASALIDPEGRVIARARATWIEPRG